MADQTAALRKENYNEFIDTIPADVKQLTARILAYFRQNPTPFNYMFAEGTVYIYLVDDEFQKIISIVDYLGADTDAPPFKPYRNNESDEIFGDLNFYLKLNQEILENSGYNLDGSGDAVEDVDLEPVMDDVVDSEDLEAMVDDIVDGEDLEPVDDVVDGEDLELVDDVVDGEDLELVDDVVDGEDLEVIEDEEVTAEDDDHEPAIETDLDVVEDAEIIVQDDSEPDSYDDYSQEEPVADDVPDVILPSKPEDPEVVDFEEPTEELATDLADAGIHSAGDDQEESLMDEPSEVVASAHASADDDLYWDNLKLIAQGVDDKALDLMRRVHSTAGMIVPVTIVRLGSKLLIRTNGDQDSFDQHYEVIRDKAEEIFEGASSVTGTKNNVQVLFG